MSTCKAKVQDDIEYMKKYYPDVNQIYDEGGLTLVSKSFLKWAKILVLAINRNINEGKIWDKQKMVLKSAVRIIINNVSLKYFFNKALVLLPEVDRNVISTCQYELVLKKINARA